MTCAKTPARPTLPRMYSITEIAEMFGRAPRTIRSWIADGRLGAIKVGNAVFIPEAEIDALLSPVSTSNKRARTDPDSADE